MHPLVCPLCRLALPTIDDVCPRDGRAGVEAAWLPVPASLAGRFRVLEPFGHGGTGSLYLADEPDTGRRGLLKILAALPREQPADRQRLRRELVKQATLQRTSLVAPAASGEAEGHTWLFREWLDGVSLEVRLSREGALQQTEALAIAAQVATALDELHRGGLLHRDVKPGHIFLQPTPHGIPRAFLLDAGVATVFPQANARLHGTPGYLAPEQLTGGLVSFRSDLYSLGCVLYRMLTGRPPFLGENPDEIFTAQRRGEVPPAPAALPNGIAALLQSILSREPQERPFSAQKLRRTLDPFLPDGALMEKQPTSTFETVPREQPSTAPQASGTLRPPPPPSVRPGSPAANSLPPTPLNTKRAPEPTQQLDIEQVLELQDILPEPKRIVSSSPPPMPEKARSVPPPASRKPPPPNEKTQPIRLDQILAVAAARKSAEPPPAAPEPPRASASAAPEPLFHAPAAAEAEPVVMAAGAHDDDETTVVPPRESDPRIHVMQEESVGRAHAAAATAKATVMGIGGDPLEPSLALPVAEVTSEREHPTERIERSVDDDDVSAAVTGSVPASTFGALGSFWADSRQMLMYASAALVGLGVLGVGASALLGGDEDSAKSVPPALPAATVQVDPTSEGAQETALAEPPRPVIEPLPAAAPAKPSEPSAASDDSREIEAAHAQAQREAQRAAEEAAAALRAESKVARAEKASSTANELSDAKVASADADKEASDARKLRREQRKAARAAKTEAAESSEKPSQFAEAREQARSHYSAKRYKEAAVAFERATQLDPSQAGPFAGLGAARLQIGDAKGALSAYQKAVQLAPDTSGFHAALGRAYIANGDKAKAIAAYKRALSLDPKNEAAKAALTQLGR